jgi:hypothetical protein
MAKYKEIFGYAEEKMPTNYVVLNFIKEAKASASVKLNTTAKKKPVKE